MRWERPAPRQFAAPALASHLEMEGDPQVRIVHQQLGAALIQHVAEAIGLLADADRHGDGAQVEAANITTGKAVRYS